MPLLTLDEIRNESPDEASFLTAQKIAIESNWTLLGRDGDVLWGVAVGSKGDDYQVYSAPNKNVLQCNCPSRKRPCKHTLALLIMEHNGHAFPLAPVPADHERRSREKPFAKSRRYSGSWE